MKKYPRAVQCDSRGQIVIPKEIRRELGIEEGSAFWMFILTNEGILLKKMTDGQLLTDDPVLKELKSKTKAAGISQKNIDSAVDRYKKEKKGAFIEL